MYQPSQSHQYLILLIAFSFVIGIIIWKSLRAQVIEASCSNIAGQSSSVYNMNKQLLDPSYSYDSVRARCLQETID